MKNGKNNIKKPVRRVVSKAQALGGAKETIPLQKKSDDDFWKRNISKKEEEILWTMVSERLMALPLKKQLEVHNMSKEDRDKFNRRLILDASKAYQEGKCYKPLTNPLARPNSRKCLNGSVNGSVLDNDYSRLPPTPSS